MLDFAKNEKIIKKTADILYRKFKGNVNFSLEKEDLFQEGILFYLKLKDKIHLDRTEKEKAVYVYRSVYFWLMKICKTNVKKNSVLASCEIQAEPVDFRNNREEYNILYYILNLKTEDRKICELLLQKFSLPEIADKMNLTPRELEKARKRIKRAMHDYRESR